MDDPTGIPNEIEVFERVRGGWTALAKDRALAASGPTAREAADRLTRAINRFDEWARRWDDDHAIVSPDGAPEGG